MKIYEKKKFEAVSFYIKNNEIKSSKKNIGCLKLKCKIISTKHIKNKRNDDEKNVFLSACTGEYYTTGF